MSFTNMSVSSVFPSSMSRTLYSHASSSTRLSGSLDPTTRSSRPWTSRHSAARPSTARPCTGLSTLGVEQQQIICAVSESRGTSPTVGLAFVNLDTGEAVLSQISDSQTYVRTLHKLMIFSPTTILVVSTAANPMSKLFEVIEDGLEEIGSNITLLSRRYWAETVGIEYIEQLAFAEDVETTKTAVNGKYYAVCCFAAVLKYVELAMSRSFPHRSLRIKYESSEGSMMIDLSTMRSLELLQNLQHAKSKDCLFGLLNETLTPMGGRLLRSNIIQPLTDPVALNLRYDALEELSTREEMFFAVRQAIRAFLDTDRTLTQLVMQPARPSLKTMEQAANSIIALKQFIVLINPVFEALTGARSPILQNIRELCSPAHSELALALINGVINEDIAYAQKPLDLRNQRTYAVKSGTNGLLDVARQTYKEAMTDALQHIADLNDAYGIAMQTKFDNARQFYLRVHEADIEQKALPDIYINTVRKKGMIECQTLDLLKLNQKITNSHAEVLMMSDQVMEQLILNIREHLPALFKVSEGIAVLDMIASFAHLVTSQDYIRPQIDETLALRAARHPLREKSKHVKFVPNDVYATQQNRFQIITGCNMSGKSTYIRTIALITVMAQIGCFVPAQYAAMPIRRQLFARVSVDDSIEGNISTFAAEMRETALILANVDPNSIVIIDELGRGTSPRDGMAIALAIAEALVQSRALIWFVTHFREIAQIMSERSGVVNLHLQVDLSRPDRMEMLYRISSGIETEGHYGLKLAKVLPLPADVIAHAEHVAQTLKERAQKNKEKGSLALIHARRRKLILNCREQLQQAHHQGAMEGSALTEWLKRLQDEFVIRMTALDDEEEEQIEARKEAELAEQDGQSVSIISDSQDNISHRT